MSDDVEFGPRGYLPQRAAKRARKIVLREQMGFGWPLAAVAASLIVVTAGVVYLLSVNRPPAAPFVAVAPLSQVPVAGGAGLPVGGESLFVLRAGGPMRVFAAPDGAALRWCGESRRIEGRAGQVWTAEGRLVGGEGSSLPALPSTVFRGVIYVDPSAPGSAPAPASTSETPAC